MILGLDTTTTFLHLALVEGEKTWTKRVMVGAGRSQSSALLPGIQELMAGADRGPEALKGVVVCVGPGGFTSLRIGVATAEGLALTGLPTWGFSAFELRARALRAAGFSEPVWILLDGQRSEVFAQFWAEDPREAACKHPLETLPVLLQGKPWWTPGEFAAKAESSAGYPPVVLADEGAVMLAGLVTLCRELPQKPAEAPLVPFYLRETDAEVNFPEASRHLSDALRQGHAR
jgi:tRNA threonylcarbamoyladenosine biosynthesis protein TsaB